MPGVRGADVIKFNFIDTAPRAIVLSDTEATPIFASWGPITESPWCVGHSIARPLDLERQPDGSFALPKEREAE